MEMTGFWWIVVTRLIQFIVVAISIHVILKKNESYKPIQAILVAMGFVIYMLIEGTLPPLGQLLPLLEIAVCILLCKFICGLSWGKGSIMGLIIFGILCILAFVQAIPFVIMYLIYMRSPGAI